jgi:uncharacterized protein YdhG (YjbR/CyaY superfamily)
MNQTTAKDVDAYIARFPEPVQVILEKIRRTIRAAAPEAKEIISYQMPAFYLHGNLVYYAAWKKHIGFYPPITGDEELRQETAIYAGEKGNLQFPLDQPMPLELITRLVKQRIKENLALAASKGKKR